MLRTLSFICLAFGATAASAQDFPVTVEHAFGETTIEERPERVASVGWANHEVPLALGIVPVGFARASWGDDDGDGLLPWVIESLMNWTQRCPRSLTRAMALISKLWPAPSPM